MNEFNSKYIYEGPPLTFNEITSLKLVIGGIIIHQDGRIEKGGKFTTTDQESVAFWEAVNKAWPRFLKLKNE